MYVRIARFEGADVDRFDAQIAEMKRQMEAAREGNVPADAPEGLQTLKETVSRFMELVDRRTGASLGMTFCETEEDMRRADEALNTMSPEEGWGSRASVEIYELALDEHFG